ncbi:hypothetical protein GGP41_003284 [Bipolaris sorokiniana]|uniref:Uncharacterized protein n=1 Tax=Cochliobolus sativus TaxID=45130 RepID=A0A8H6DTB1_COCSA|nr:hypothetical protein GGP41_003284 [Bipolaris sorokiniana]
MNIPNSSTAPAAGEYAGDEVSAIVLDPGYSTVRAGFAGEDVPKSATVCSARTQYTLRPTDLRLRITGAQMA